MRIETVVKEGSLNACYVCGAALTGEYFEVNLHDGVVALMVCSNDCEADVWMALMEIAEVEL